MALLYCIVPVTAFEQNCSLIWCDETQEAVVVDPGGDLNKIEAEVEKRQVKLLQIWLTHAHIDHAGGTFELSSKRSLPIIGPHREDQFWIDLLPQQSQMFGFPQAPSFTPSRWLEEGDTVQVGNEPLSVMHCPGHTPGHVVFYHEKSALLIVGDVLFQGSIGRTDFPKGDHQTLVQSIQQKLWPLGDHVEFIPGHGPMSNIGHEKRTNPFVGAYG